MTEYKATEVLLTAQQIQHILGTCKASEILFEFKSDDSDSIQKWQAELHLPPYHKPRSLFIKKLPTVGPL